MRPTAVKLATESGKPATALGKDQVDASDVRTLGERRSSPGCKIPPKWQRSGHPARGIRIRPIRFTGQVARTAKGIQTSASALPAPSAAALQGLLREILHVDVRVLLQLHEHWPDGRVHGGGVQAVVLHHPRDGPAGAEADVGHVVLRGLDQQRHDELHDLVRGHDPGDLRQHVERGDAVRVARTLGVLLHQLRQQVLHGPLRAEGVRDLAQVVDSRLAHGVHGVAEAGQEERLELLLEHVHAEDFRELGDLLHDALADAPVVVEDQVLDGVQEGVHQAVDA
eukprot:CAMPEP_0179124116 /NCGR_PEP_ID=MMETSP0796-20121207/58638_1 /TAXON_ID=73915 /ORGANISM="Pyrodinium bahamense, Strain pbaha01" /LENGTH=281 /DNA_ID=CAMNT_0020822765 /DNA_START=191 /DNA_END=1033 /DNA_ORIENTATION=+